MPQLLRELVTIAEDQGPIPSTPIMVHNPRTRGPMSSSGFYGHQKPTQYTCVHVGKISIYLEKKSFKNNGQSGLSGWQPWAPPHPQGWRAQHLLVTFFTPHPPWFSTEVQLLNKAFLVGSRMLSWFHFLFQSSLGRKCRFSNPFSTQCSHQTEGQGGFKNVGPWEKAEQRKPEAQAWDALQGTVVSTPAHTSQRGGCHSHLQGLRRQPMMQKGHGHAFWLFLSPIVEPWEGEVPTRSLNRSRAYVPDYVQSRQDHVLPRWWG